MAMLGSLLPLVSLLLLSLVSGLRGALLSTSMSDVMKACDLNGADVLHFCGQPELLLILVQLCLSVYDNQ